MEVVGASAVSTEVRDDGAGDDLSLFAEVLVVFEVITDDPTYLALSK